MDSGSRKLYHVHDCDSRSFLDTYASDNPDMVFADESLRFPMEKLHQLFTAGHIKGDVLVDISVGPLIHHLYSACDYFKDIYILKFNDTCIMEVNKWRHTRTGAFDWNHTSSYVTQLEGNSESSEEKDMKLKTAIKDTVKCDIDKENLTDPIELPPADCIISVGILDVISKDRDDYIAHLRKIVKLLKCTGYLILFGGLNTTYITIGQERFHFFKYDEDHVKEVLAGEGFIIDHCDVLRKKSVSDLTDYDGILFIAAHREKICT